MSVVPELPLELIYKIMRERITLMWVERMDEEITFLANMIDEWSGAPCVCGVCSDLPTIPLMIGLELEARKDRLVRNTQKAIKLRLFWR